MKRLLFIAALLISIQSFSQQICTVTAAPCSDPTLYLFVVIPTTFVNKYQHSKTGVNEFFAVQTTSGCWVTSANALDEFPNLFREFNQDKLNAQYVQLTLCNFAGGTVSQTAVSEPIQPDKKETKRTTIPITLPYKTFAYLKRDNTIRK